MAVNKNFVVKNGLEVNDNLLVADVASQKVGIGTSVASYDLHVLGGIGATESYVSGVGTFADDLYVLGNLNVTGDVVYDEVTGRNIYISGISTFNQTNTTDLNVTGVSTLGIVSSLYVHGISTVTGIATFQSDVFVDGNLNVVGDIVYDEVSGRNIYISGLSTFVGVGTFHDDLWVRGNLNVAGDIAYDEVTGRNINITGVSTFDGIKIGDPSGIVTASTATGIVTYYGDASNLTGFAPGLSAAIGVGSESTFVGAGITEVYFATTTGQNVNVVKNGTKATVTVTPGVSLGLAIALGG